MKLEEAKELGFTHHAKMYGVPIWFKYEGAVIQTKNKFFSLVLEFLIYLELVFEFNEQGFPIEVGEEI